MLYALLFALSLLDLSSIARAEPISLFAKDSAAPVLQSYDEGLNFSPAFHVWQNDPELAAFYTQKFEDGSGVTDLCVPASLADLLLFQISAKPHPLSHLKIPGLSDSAHANGAEVVKALIETCQFQPRSIAQTDGFINWEQGSDCLNKIYQDSGYFKNNVHYIRKSMRKSVDKDGRYPELADIQIALSSGKEVIAVLSFQKKDPATGLTREVSSHAVNVFGYSVKKSDQDQKLVIYLQNSNRRYSENFKNPVFDTAELVRVASESPDAAHASGIELSTLSGRLLNFPDTRTFLSGLVIIETLPTD